MKFYGAQIKEQGVTFAIVIVKPSVLNNKANTTELINTVGIFFGGVPVILMAKSPRRVPTYYGRSDIVKFLAKVPIQAIPWREYTIS